MKKWLLLPIVAVMLGAILLSGCAAGVAPADFAAVQSDLAALQSDLTAAQNQIEALEAQVASLAAISAYYGWYDVYLEEPTFVFADTATFNAKLGALVQATRHSASIAAWDAYLAADTALSDVLAALPEDYETWTEEQTAQWTEADTARTEAYGEVGTALYSAIVE